jgi:hypothetical protein
MAFGPAFSLPVQGIDRRSWFRTLCRELLLQKALLVTDADRFGALYWRQSSSSSEFFSRPTAVRVFPACGMRSSSSDAATDITKGRCHARLPLPRHKLSLIGSRSPFFGPGCRLGGATSPDRPRDLPSITPPRTNGHLATSARKHLLPACVGIGPHYGIGQYATLGGEPPPRLASQVQASPKRLWVTPRPGLQSGRDATGHLAEQDADPFVRA